MSVNQLSICNLALIRCGASRISSITQDTKPAIALNAIWELSRDTVMADHPWNFALKRALLAPTSNTPVYEFNYEYDKPSDMLRLMDLDSNDIDYVVENGKILSDETELNVRYVFRNTDESSWSPGFADALAWYLVMQIGFTLTQQTKLTEEAGAAYKASLAQARFVDGSEGIMRRLEATVWTNARR